MALLQVPQPAWKEYQVHGLFCLPYGMGRSFLGGKNVVSRSWFIAFEMLFSQRFFCNILAPPPHCKSSCCKILWRNSELGAGKSAGSLVWVAGTQFVEPSTLPRRHRINRKLELGAEPGVQPTHSSLRCGHHNIFITKPSTCFRVLFLKIVHCT